MVRACLYEDLAGAADAVSAVGWNREAALNGSPTESIVLGDLEYTQTLLCVKAHNMFEWFGHKGGADLGHRPDCISIG